MTQPVDASTAVRPPSTREKVSVTWARASVGAALRERLAEARRLEGYDMLAVLAEALRPHGGDPARAEEFWPRAPVEGTRGRIQFSRVPGISVRQWASAPVQVVDRDPAEPDRFRVLRVG